MSRLIKALRVCGRLQDALARAEEGLERFPGFTDLVLEQATITLALGRTEEAIELYERCIQMGDAPRRYTATVGCGTYLPRIFLAELRRAQGQIEQASSLLEECLLEHPQFLGSVLPYASALLAQGTEPQAVVERIERNLPNPSPAARFMLGTALYEAGATVEGEKQFRAVLERQPHSSRARVALGEALLAQRRYEEAAAAAGELSPEDPLAVMASRTELFAHIVGGDFKRARQALDLVGATGMQAEEVELFTGWLELASDGQTTVSPTAEAVALVRVILEALLRVQDFQAFETLLELLRRTSLTQRQQRHLLADMYLRRGFLASAAEEWMAICAEEPDVPALQGLARIAGARGMIPEAIDFASAALARDPANQPLATLLSQFQAAHARDNEREHEHADAH
jgi:tetratricopeptide (TPR) repeat protein